jgi:hypothetical protein
MPRGALVVGGGAAQDFETRAVPCDVVTVQTVVEAHATALGVAWASITKGALHAVPFHRAPCPEASTVRQNVVPRQETPTSLLPALLWFSESTGIGADHALPFQVKARPLVSTAMQNVVVVHDTASI